MEKSKNGSENLNAPKGLKKEIGLIEATTIVIGVVIGSGIFFKASSVFRNAGTPVIGIMAWVVGGLITIASALTVAEIAVAIPKTGGVLIYIKELYGEKWAFLFGWVQTLIYVPGVAAALSIVFVTQATYFIPTLTPIVQKVLAICILFVVMALNILSTRLGGKVQVIFTIGKLIPIIFIVLFGLINGTAHDFSTPVVVSASAGSGGTAGFGAAILGTLWAYDGWISVGNMAGELRNPEKDLPKSIIMGLVTIVIVYILINVAIINIMPVNDVVVSPKPASDAAIILFGEIGASLIAIGIMISIFGALNGYLMTGVRIPFAMAQDNIFPFANFFGKINEKLETPVNTFVFEVVLATLYVLSGSFDTLTNLAVFVMWIFFVMCVAGIFILRRKNKRQENSYKVPLYPIIPLIGIVGGVYILVSTFITDSLSAIYGIGITLIGLPVYFYIKKKNMQV